MHAIQLTCLSIVNLFDNDAAADKCIVHKCEHLVMVLLQHLFKSTAAISQNPFHQNRCRFRRISSYGSRLELPQINVKSPAANLHLWIRNEFSEHIFL